MTKCKNKFNKTEFSKILVTAIALILFAYGIWAGAEFYHHVSLYYETVRLAIENGQEYINIYQPDPQLAIVCVTSILGSFLTYCIYNGALKLSLNSNQLCVDKASGVVSAIMNPNTTEAVSDVLKKAADEVTKKPKKDIKSDEDSDTNIAAG